MFLCVAKRLNLSKAADTMGISQPAMSAQIKKMELELGVPFFVRDTHTVYLTPEGETVRAHFQQVLADYEKLAEDLEALKRRREQLYIGWHGPTNWAGIQDLFFLLVQKHEAIYARNKNAAAEELLQDLERGEIDVAFLEKGMAENRRQLRKAELFQDAICFGMSMEHPLARRERVTAEELRGQKIFYKKTAYAGIKDSLAMLIQAGIPAEELVCLDSLDISVVTAMAQGGMVVFPSSFKILGNRTVSYAELEPPVRPITYCLVWRAGNDNPQLPRFVEFCRKFRWPGQEPPREGSSEIVIS